MKQYDEAQRQAIAANGGYYLVLAPPGCGKTDILAERIAEARSRGVAFSEMLCLTFTNRASRGMRNRVVERIGEDPEGLFVGNIHRFCSNFLFRQSIIAANTCIIDEDEQADILLTFDDKAFSNARGQVNKTAVGAVVDLASYIQQTDMGHPASVKFGTPDAAELYKLAARCNFQISQIPAEKETLIYALKYLAYKQEHAIIDFSDILIFAYESLLRNPDHRRYPWVQIDEVQDLNALQMAIADQLTDTRPGFTAMYLGDEQQAIFSFMGAKLGQLQSLKNRCKGHILTLDNNYRSPEYLLNVCNTYAVEELGVDPDLLPKATTHDSGDRLDLILCESADAYQEDDRVIKMVDYYLRLSSDERVAVLVPTNLAADRVSASLNRVGISNFKISGRDMFRTKPYKALASLFAVIANDFNSMAWARLLHGTKIIPTMRKARGFTAKLKSLMMTPTDVASDETYLQKFIKTYDEQEIVFFDTETTGLNVQEDDIVQIAAFKVRNGQKVVGSDFNIIMETEREIPRKLGEIDNPLIAEYAEREHLRRAVGLRMFLDYVGDDPMLGHNVMYDYRILRANVARTLGKDVRCEVFDSLHIVKCVEPRLRRYKLAFLLKELQLEGNNSHLANEDIEATKAVVDHCVAKARPMLPQQRDFLDKVKTLNLKEKMQPLMAMIERISERADQPVEEGRNALADELRAAYDALRSADMLGSLGEKFDVFLRFVRSEWGSPGKRATLLDQIGEHVNDLTSSISEGDLVGSNDLLTDRVFIMTIYKGKGLEFENVIVLGAVSGTYPFYTCAKVLQARDLYKKEEVERAQREWDEDARKFYVAISRAKKRLCVSYSMKNSWGIYTTLTPFMRSISHYFFTGRR